MTCTNTGGPVVKCHLMHGHSEINTYSLALTKPELHIIIFHACKSMKFKYKTKISINLHEISLHCLTLIAD